MKKTPFYLILVILLCSCSVIKSTETRYLTLNEIKRDYQLTKKQCRQIEKTDSIKSHYFGAIDLRVYDAGVDYSIFKY
jgi:hypothetical protein